MIRSLALGAFALLPFVADAASAQDGGRRRPPREYTDEQVDKLIRSARTGSAIIRPQAAERLVQVGKRAADKLDAVAGDSNRELAALGTALVEVLGKFGDDRLRGRLWPAIEDSEFPWRPAASRSLAHAATADEWERFEGFVDDPIAPVRLACLDALARISADGPDERKAAFLRHAAAQLSDENDVVRRNAALHLDRRGHGRALLWLFEDLKRTDTFCGSPTGEAARYASLYAFEDRGIALGDYDPDDPSTKKSVAALESLRARLVQRAAGMEKALPAAERTLVPREIPAIARASGPLAGIRLALQLRSCRRGDFYLRWTEDDHLVVGTGNAARVPLKEGATKALIEAAARTTEATGKDVYWGRPGCDMEFFTVPRPGGAKDDPLQLILSKDEQPMDNLRPRALTTLGAAMAASIPSDDELDQDDPRTRELAARVRAAFASIGGAVPPTADGAQDGD
jgi:hypothetical protein